MTTLTILRGVPGSGKSTEAEAYRQRGDTIVNRDSIRFSLYGKYWGKPINEDVVTQVEDAAITAALRAGTDTVVDATNLRNAALKTKLSLASRYGATVEFVDFPIDVETAVNRDALRDRKVGEKVIREFFKRYKIDPVTGVLPKAPDLWPTFEPAVFDETKPKAFIVDTDGTVANHEGIRNPYDTTKYRLDTVHEHVAHVVASLATANLYIIGLSGRDEEFSKVTKDWWDHNGIPFDEFYFRPTEKNKRVDAIIKYELFKTHIEPNYNVLGAFDDRPQVIRMWETIGVPVFNVGHGEGEF